MLCITWITRPLNINSLLIDNGLHHTCISAFLSITSHKLWWAPLNMSTFIYFILFYISYVINSPKHQCAIFSLMIMVVMMGLGDYVLCYHFVYVNLSQVTMIKILLCYVLCYVMLCYHDDVIKWKHFPRNWPFVRGIHRSRWIPRTKASDAELWCLLWSAPELTIE